MQVRGFLLARHPLSYRQTDTQSVMRHPSALEVKYAVIRATEKRRPAPRVMN